jgi:putative alpha-1,2-mannosidase
MRSLSALAIYISVSVISLSVVRNCPGQQVADFVNRLVGTAGQGQTFPIAGVPFAMTDWTPQTRDGETKCGAPYYFADKRIQSFRGSHFLSGSCTQDYGSFTLMPVSGRLKLTADSRASAFTHADEIAHPYQYSVRLSDYDVRADMTGTLRCGLLRFHYNRPGPAWLVIQSNRRPGDSQGQLHFDAKSNEVSGSNTIYRLYAGNGKPAGFKGYVVIRFDRIVASHGAWNADPASSPQAAKAQGHDLYLRFVSTWLQ